MRAIADLLLRVQVARMVKSLIKLWSSVYLARVQILSGGYNPEQIPVL
jgi:hypothetical protein